MTIWRLTTHHEDPERLFAQAKAGGWIPVGWNGVGNLKAYASEAEVKAAVRRTGNRNGPSPVGNS